MKLHKNTRPTHDASRCLPQQGTGIPTKNAIKGRWHVCLAAALLCAATAVQAAWPDRPVTMVVPFPAGGPTDLVARVVAKQLGERLGQPFIVENKGGASGTIGMQVVAVAKPDGYTLLYNTSTLALTPHLYRNLSYDTRTAFAPVSSTVSIPLVLMTHPSVPAKTVQEFVAYLKEKKGAVSYGSAGPGNVTHLSSVMLLQAVGAQAQHIPYRGSAPAMIDLVGGQTQFTTNTLNDSLAFLRDGRLRALAITSRERSDQLPDVPTLGETIMPGFETGAWQGVMVPAGTPEAIVQKLNAAILTALDSDEMTRQLVLQGAQKMGSTPKAYGDYIAADSARWQKVIEAAGVKLD